MSLTYRWRPNRFLLLLYDDISGAHPKFGWMALWASIPLINIFILIMFLLMEDLQLNPDRKVITNPFIWILRKVYRGKYLLNEVAPKV